MALEQPPTRNLDIDKLNDAEFSKKTDWINALQKDLPSLPNYFADLIVTYCMNNPEEAEAVMNGEEAPAADQLIEWKKSVKKQNIIVE